MPVVIEEIVHAQHMESDAFIRTQQKRLMQLKEIQQRKNNGKRVKKNRIVKELQESGILDKNGNLSKYYSE